MTNRHTAQNIVQWWPKLLEQYFHQLKIGFKSVISIFVVVCQYGKSAYISKHSFPPLIVIIQ